MSNNLARREAGKPFSLVSKDSAPRRISINARSEMITTVIDRSARFDGDLKLEHGLKIDGYVKGGVKFGSGGGLLIVSESGTVEGPIVGPKALIQGNVLGSIDIAGTLVIAPTAIIAGDVRCGDLVIYPGATVSGSMETHRAQRTEPKPTVQPEADKPVADKPVADKPTERQPSHLNRILSKLSDLTRGQ